MAKDLSILVVEDSGDKYERIIQELASRLAGIDCRFLHAPDYNSAVHNLSGQNFDLVVLDLLIPISQQSGSPSLENSRALISLLTSEQQFPAPHVIGLTEHDNAAEGERNYYIENMFALEVFSWTNEQWAERVSAKIRYLEKSKRASVLYANSNYETDILVLTARYENEFKAIKSKMKWESDPLTNSVYFPGTQCAIGRLVLDAGVTLSAVVLCAGEMGLAAAAALTSHAINIYRPRLVVSLGMCCGFSRHNSAGSPQFGDVLVAREAACWEEGKYAELPTKKRQFQTRAVTRTVDEVIGPTVSASVEMQSDVIIPAFKKYMITKDAKSVREMYVKQMRTIPEVKYGLIVSGSSVIADGAQIDEIIQRHPSALGLEMEIFGIYTAVQKSIGPKKPSVLGIKGVADFGDGEKHDKIQAYASILSFYTMLSLLRRLYAKGGVVSPVA